MSFAMIVGLVLAVLIATLFVLLFRRLLGRSTDAEADLEWSSEFSVAKYRPMERLFIEEDYDFLAAQPGFHPRIYRKLQSERRRIFRHYLRCMERDFERLATTAHLLLLSAPDDQPEMSRSLMKQRLTFRFALALIEFRLMLQPLGLGQVDVRRLVDAVETMRDQLRQISATAAA